MPEVSYIEVLVHEGSTLDMGDSEEIMVREGTNDKDLGGADSDEVPFVAAIADIHSSVASVVGKSPVSSLLGIMPSSSFGLNVPNKHKKL